MLLSAVYQENDVRNDRGDRSTAADTVQLTLFVELIIAVAV